MPDCRKSAAKRFFQTAVIQAALMLLEAALVLACILWPEVKVLPLLAGIAAMWALVAFGFAFGRFYKHVVRPCSEHEKVAQALARGDFPPSAPPRPREFFPELSRSINLLRDRLQYLEATLRERRTREQLARGDDAGAALQARVYARILARLYPAIALADGYLAQAKRDPETAQAAAEQTARALRQLGELAASLQADTGEGAESDFDLSLFLRDFDDAAQSYLRRRRMSLSCSYGAELPAALHGDRVWLDRELRDLLHILALESDDGRRLELACTADAGTVEFSFTDPADNHLAAAFQQSQDADSGQPGEETALTLLELRLAAARAERHLAELTVEGCGETGSRIRLALGAGWTAAPEPGHAGNSRFVESSRRAAPAPRPAAGPGLIVARDPGFAALLKTLHPGTEWTAATPEHLPACDGFEHILAIVPAEIADRHLQTLENTLVRAAARGAAVTVIDPGLHRRFRRHLRECGIRNIADMPPLDRAVGDRRTGA